LWSKGFSAARYYTYAWIFYLIGMTISLLGFLGVYGVNFWIKTALGTGTMIEVTLISLALMEKFRILREEREAAVRALMEESQKNARQQQLLVQQSKLAEIGEIFGMVVHQWKQPLSSIGLISELISEDSKYGTVTKENIAENTAKIKEQVRFMAQTITDFQNFLKPSAEGRRFDIRKALEEITSLVSPAVRSRNVTITLEADSLEVTGFRNEFMQVALNLINNAIESIETTKQDGKILITAHKEGTKARITIEDNGSGIPEAVRERLFELFATTKGEKGTGMGLYMSRIIVEEKMGGRLTLENLPDCGAAAVIELPAGN
jgi:signal transduction histidine kinase